MKFNEWIGIFEADPWTSRVTGSCVYLHIIIRMTRKF